MALKEFKDYPDTTTPINSENLNFNFEEVLNMAFDAMYPINKIVVFYDTKDHSDYLGFTWELVSKGNFPVGYNPEDTDYNQIGKTGGEKMHKLIADELPPTYIYPNEGKNDPITGGFDTTTGVNYYSLKTGVTNNNSPKLTANNPIMHTALAHENRPPYEVMAFWRRTS